MIVILQLVFESTYFRDAVDHMVTPRRIGDIQPKESDTAKNRLGAKYDCCGSHDQTDRGQAELHHHPTNTLWDCSVTSGKTDITSKPTALST